MRNKWDKTLVTHPGGLLAAYLPMHVQGYKQDVILHGWVQQLPVIDAMFNLSIGKPLGILLHCCQQSKVLLY